jgi:hypothetical protein
LEQKLLCHPLKPGDRGESVFSVQARASRELPAIGVLLSGSFRNCCHVRIPLLAQQYLFAIVSHASPRASADLTSGIIAQFKVAAI